MAANMHPIPVSVVSPEVLHSIGTMLYSLLETEARLKAEIEALEADGCIAGHLATEYRNVNGEQLGPYYRLHFYTDLATGEKKPPQYIGGSPHRVADVRRKIENQARRETLKNQLEDIQGAVYQAGKGFKQVNAYLQMRLLDFQQLVMPEPQPADADVTKS